MSSSCSNDCSSCGESCSERKAESFLDSPNQLSKIRHIVAVCSGKGGVGKSTVTSLLAVGLARKGFKVGIIDADITGPSIAKAFGVTDTVTTIPEGIIPVKSQAGAVSIISMNQFLEDPEDPVIWRGPVIAGAVKQFYTDVIWKDIDFLLVDMPPGTGDVPLTVFQSIPVEGVVVVTTPQSLVEMIVGKAIRMCEKMNKPIVGIVENMAYYQCSKCSNKEYIFGKSDIVAQAKKYDITNVCQLPINPQTTELIDKGLIEETEFTIPSDFITEIVYQLENEEE